MNVFVLCSGRCGSTTFIRACEHLSNFTAGHESRVTLMGDERLAYPPDHIEADNRLAWFLGPLDERFGASAYYVHLTRHSDAVARSLVKQGNLRRSIVTAYRVGIVREGNGASDLEAAHDCVTVVNANIRHFLKDKPRVMQMQLESLSEQFPSFLDWIGAEGDLDAAVAETERHHNATPPNRVRYMRMVRRPVGRLLRSLNLR